MRHKAHGETLLTVFKATVVPSYLYGYKTWTHRAGQIRTEATEIRFLKWVTNLQIRNEVKKSEQNWNLTASVRQLVSIEHVLGMADSHSATIVTRIHIAAKFDVFAAVKIQFELFW